MSSAVRAARLLMEIEPQEFRILQAIELGMSGYSFVPLKEVVKYSGLKQGEVTFRLRELDRKELLYRQPEPYPGYILNYTAYDCLALNALTKANLLSSLGRSLGVGKEADIFDAITDDGLQVAVKFHRLGRTSFRETRRKRGYIAKRGHITCPWRHKKNGLLHTARRTGWYPSGRLPMLIPDAGTTAENTRKCSSSWRMAELTS